MADTVEIITAIRRGNDRVVEVFGALTDAQLAIPVHAGAGGWTARDVLAHLAGRAAVYDMLIQRAAGGAAPDMGNFDVDAFNQLQIDALAGRGRDQLLDEFRAAHEQLIARVAVLSEAQLQTAIPFPSGPISLGDVLLRSGGTHSANHAAEVAAALEDIAG